MRYEMNLTAALPRVTVVMPHFNDPDGLERALASLEAQTMREFELAIVDDGSTPANRHRMSDLLAAVSFPVRALYHVRNLGAAAARNGGVAMSQAPIVALLDSDDFFLPDKLAWLVAAFDNRAHDLIVHGYRNWLGQDVDARGVIALDDWPWWLVALKNPGVTPAVSFRRDMAIDFDESFRRFDDQLFLVTYARKHGPIRISSHVATVVPKPIIGVAGLSGRFGPMFRAELAYIRAMSRFGIGGVLVIIMLALLLVPRVVRRLGRLAAVNLRHRHRAG
jgi:glycosyltransferase involved in cell wall biosynthesis